MCYNYQPPRSETQSQVNQKEASTRVNNVGPEISVERTEQLITLCQEEADVSISECNVHIACIITDIKGNIVFKAHNTQNTEFDPTAHAEINALRFLCKAKKTRYLDGHAIFSNAEICSMCASASIKAHIYAFYYGAKAEPSMDPWIPITEIAKVSKKSLFIKWPILGDECF